MGSNGVLAGIATGFAAADATQCLTDTFTITNQENLPVICGVNSGYHVYFDADDDCHQLNFQLGNVANGLTTVATRTWSIKVSQYSCDYENLAPTGCDQYHFASSSSNYVQTFNFQMGRGTGRHLANQHQQICVRREAGMCRICYSVDNIVTDIGITGKIAGKVGFKGEDCCGYGAAGAGGDTGGGDCIIIPGGSKGAAISAVGVMLLSDAFCGSMMGLNTNGAAAMPKTVCSQQTPFRIEFLSDNFEVGGAATAEAAGGNTGFKIRYFQTSC